MYISLSSSVTVAIERSYHFICFEVSQGFAESHRQFLDVFTLFDRFVDVAFFRLTWIKLIVDAIIHRREQCRPHDVRVDHRIHRSVLKTTGCRNAQTEQPTDVSACR